MSSGDVANPTRSQDSSPIWPARWPIGSLDRRMRSTVATPSRSDVAQVGFIGLGDMGGAIASRIIDAGFPTVCGRGARRC